MLDKILSTLVLHTRTLACICSTRRKSMTVTCSPRSSGLRLAGKKGNANSLVSLRFLFLFFGLFLLGALWVYVKRCNRHRCGKFKHRTIKAQSTRSEKWKYFFSLPRYPEIKTERERAESGNGEEFAASASCAVCPLAFVCADMCVCIRPMIARQIRFISMSKMRGTSKASRRRERGKTTNCWRYSSLDRKLWWATQINKSPHRPFSINHFGSLSPSAPSCMRVSPAARRLLSPTLIYSELFMAETCNFRSLSWKLKNQLILISIRWMNNRNYLSTNVE